MSACAGVRLCALLTAVLALSACKGKWEKKTEEVGYVGEARRDPFLAYKRLLEEWGWGTRKARGLAQLPDYYDTLVLASDAVTTGGAGARLEDWVADGGHLIYCLSGTGKVSGRTGDDGDFSFGDLFREDGRDEFVLDRFGVERSPEDDGDLEASPGFTVREFSVDGDEELEVDIGGRELVALGDGGSSWRRSDVVTDSGDGTSAKFLSFGYGEGRLSVLADAGSLRNNEIDELDHARFGIGLALLGYGGDVWFITDPHRSIWPLVWKKGWMVVIALLALIAFWLWKNLARFGPVSEGDDAGLGAARRERFLDHLLTGGRFLWRKKCGGTLLEPVRRSILRLYEQKVPDDGGADIVDVLSDRTGLPTDRVQRAIFDQSITDGSTMVAVVRDLQHIESKL